jgi:hypothetical protein
MVDGELTLPEAGRFPAGTAADGPTVSEPPQPKPGK